MSDWPVQIAPAEVVVVSTPQLFGAAIAALSPGGSYTGVAWPTANRAIFVPFPVYQPTTFYRLACYNGSTVSGNVDMGLYDEAGNRIVSIGSTAQAGTDAIQEFNITDTTLLPGWFYIGIAMNGTTGTIQRFSVGTSVEGVGSLGIVQMASAFALPATATYARSASALAPYVMAAGRATL